MLDQKYVLPQRSNLHAAEESQPYRLLRQEFKRRRQEKQITTDCPKTITIGILASITFEIVN